MLTGLADPLGEFEWSGQLCIDISFQPQSRTCLLGFHRWCRSASQHWDRATERHNYGSFDVKLFKIRRCV